MSAIIERITNKILALHSKMDDGEFRTLITGVATRLEQEAMDMDVQRYGEDHIFGAYTEEERENAQSAYSY